MIDDLVVLKDGKVKKITLNVEKSDNNFKINLNHNWFRFETWSRLSFYLEKIYWLQNGPFTTPLGSFRPNTKVAK